MGHIKVGKPDTTPDAPAHVKGVHQGNSKPRRRKGHNENGTVSARRSTGINAKKREPILPIMPNLPPG